MKLNMQILKKVLEPYKPVVELKPISDLYLKSVRLWDGDISQLSEEYVYVTTAECLLSCYTNSKLQNAICVGYNQYVFHKFEGQANIIALECDISLLDLYNLVLDIFYQYNDYLNQFLSAIIAHRPLDDILQAMAPFFQNPVIMLDNSRMKVAVTETVGGKTIDRKKWRSILEYGHVEPSTVKTIAKRRMAGEGAQRKAYFDSVNPTIYSAINVNLWNDNEIIGFILIPEDFTKLNQGFLGLLDFLAKFITDALLKQKYITTTHYTVLGQFFNRLLDGASVSLEFERLHLDMLNWSLQDRFICCVIELNESERIGECYDFEAKRIKTVFRDCFYLSREGNQVFIINLRSGSMGEDVKAQLKALLAERGTYAGFSLEMTGVSMLSSQYVLAIEALRLGKGMAYPDNVFFYRNYIESHLIDMRRRPANMLALCHEKVLELYQSDKKNDTEYVDTLYVYLRNERSLIKSASQLFIHRNSLVYRMEKIKEILKLDLDCTDLRTYLFISCKVIRHYEKNLPN